MLGHTRIERHVVILAPSTEWVKKEDWVLESLLEELFAGVLKQEDVSIMKWVSDLECVDGVSVLLLDHFRDLGGSLSVGVDAVVECHSFGKAGWARDEEVTLCDDGLCLGVLCGPGSECSGADLFLSVVEEDWLADDGENVVADGAALDCNRILALQFFLLFSGHGLGNWAWHQMSCSDGVSDCLHL